MSRSGIVVFVLTMAAAACAPAASPDGSASLGPSRTPGAAPTGVATAPPTASPTPVSATDPEHVTLGGRGPLGLTIDDAGDRAWVVLTDSGDLADVDLADASVSRTISIGPGAAQVVAADGSVYIGRYDAGPTGEGIVVVDDASGDVSTISIDAVGGLALEGPSLWAFLKTGDVLRIDRATGAITGSVSVHVDQDAHMDAVAGAGSVWVSGDRTPVHRISGPDPKIVADIETGGGIPLDFAEGLVWGARPDEVWAIDPATDAVVRRVPLEGVDEILAMAVDGDEAWIAIRRPGRVGAVIGIDLPTATVFSETRVSLPAGVQLTPERVWVTDYEGDDLVGIRRD